MLKKEHSKSSDVILKSVLLCLVMMKAQNMAALHLSPFAHSPAGLLFHVVVFITKSNILLCYSCHPSPGVRDSEKATCVCVFVLGRLSPLIEL